MGSLTLNTQCLRILRALLRERRGPRGSMALSGQWAWAQRDEGMRTHRFGP